MHLSLCACWAGAELLEDCHKWRFYSTQNVTVEPGNNQSKYPPGFGTHCDDRTKKKLPVANYLQTLRNMHQGDAYDKLSACASGLRCLGTWLCLSLCVVMVLGWWSEKMKDLKRASHFPSMAALEATIRKQSRLGCSHRSQQQPGASS